MIKVEIVADSINICGNRLTSYILEFPRFILSEIATHRMFSKNAASSRAIPIEKMIQQIIDNPAMPVWWGKNQSGMQANEELNNSEIRHQHIMEYNDYDDRSFTDKGLSQAIWLESRDLAIKQVKKLNELGLHKQIANRLLEPWFNIRIILSGTEFSNFFALRAHKDAQPEFQKLAYLMLDLYNNSAPKELKEGEWHIPFGDKFDEVKLNEIFLEGFKDSKDYGTGRLIDQIKQKISIARCARISYFNYKGKDDYRADIKLCDRLFRNIPRHLSPTEHVAMSINKNEFIGNFKGFKQYRYFFQDQNLEDSRIKK